MLEVLPGTRIVEIVRDPRDVLCSKIKAEWSKRRPWWFHVFVSRAQLNYHGKVGNASHLVIYEQLLADPEKVMRDVCEFLEVEYSSAMLRHEVAAARLMRQSESSWKRNTLQPILSDNVENWRTQLSPFQAHFVESLTWSNPLIADNYQQAGRSMPLWQRVVCWAAVAASSVVQVAYRWKR